MLTEIKQQSKYLKQKVFRPIEKNNTRKQRNSLKINFIISYTTNKVYFNSGRVLTLIVTVNNNNSYTFKYIRSGSGSYIMKNVQFVFRLLNKIKID